MALMKSAVALFVILLGLWLAASGHYTTMMITFGVLSCLGVVLLCRKMGIVDDESVPVHLLGRAVRYLPWIAFEVLKANLDVTRRLLSFKPAVSPEVFDVPTSQRTDLGRVLYANSITLTPGTVSILVAGSHIKVHAIAKSVADGLKTGEMDRQVTRLEGRG